MMTESATNVTSPDGDSGQGPDAAIRSAMLSALVEGLSPTMAELGKRAAHEAWAMVNAALWRALGIVVVGLMLFWGGYWLGTKGGDCAVDSSAWGAPPILPPQAAPPHPSGP
jgi:hypothetical protein